MYVTPRSTLRSVVDGMGWTCAYGCRVSGVAVWQYRYGLPSLLGVVCPRSEISSLFVSQTSYVKH